MNLQKYRTYQCWNNMLFRCKSPKSVNYSRYGGRGINVCDRWQESFAFFIEDMGLRPEGMTLDRINNNGPYSPDNCRWATHIENNRNKSVPASQLTINGVTRYEAEWASIAGIQRRTIRMRVRMGWPAEAAVFTPITPRSKRSILNSNTVNKQGKRSN